MPDTDVHIPIVLDLAGVAVGAAQGTLFGRSRPGMSAVGVAVLAFVTAFGGAMIRDALMAVSSASLSNPYLFTWICATLVTLLIAHLERRLTGALTVLDAAYLGIWTVAGADKADHLEFGIPAVVLLGVITGVGGGILRDILAGQVPTVFLSGPLYTVASLVGSATFVGLYQTPLPRPLDVVIAASEVFLVRMLALRQGWLLPPASDFDPLASRSWWRRHPN